MSTSSPSEQDEEDPRDLLVAKYKKTADEAQEHVRAVEKQLLAKMAKIDDLKDALSKAKRETKYAIEDRVAAQTAKTSFEQDLVKYMRIVEEKTTSLTAMQGTVQTMAQESDKRSAEAAKARSALAEFKKTCQSKIAALNHTVAAQRSELKFMRRGWLHDIYTMFNPAKLTEAEDILQKYKGYETQLFEAMQKKYDFAAKAKETAALERRTRSLEKQLTYALKHSDLKAADNPASGNRSVVLEAEDTTTPKKGHSAASANDASGKDGHVPPNTVAADNANSNPPSPTIEDVKSSPIEDVDQATETSKEQVETSESVDENSAVSAQTSAEIEADASAKSKQHSEQSPDGHANTPDEAVPPSVITESQLCELNAAHDEEVQDLIGSITTLKSEALAAQQQIGRLTADLAARDNSVKKLGAEVVNFRRRLAVQSQQLRMAYQQLLSLMYSLTQEKKDEAAIKELLDKYKGAEQDLINAVQQKYHTERMGAELLDLRRQASSLKQEVSNFRAKTNNQSEVIQQYQAELANIASSSSLAAQTASEELMAEQSLRRDWEAKHKVVSTEVANLERKIVSVEQSLETNRSKVKKSYEEKVALQRQLANLEVSISNRENFIMTLEDRSAKLLLKQALLGFAVRKGSRSAFESKLRCQISKPGMGKSQVDEAFA